MASAADDGIVSVGELGNKIMGIGHFGRPYNVFRTRVWCGISDIFCNAASEQKRFVKDKADLRSQVGDGRISYVDAIDGNAAFVDVIQAADEIDNGRFSRT